MSLKYVQTNTLYLAGSGVVLGATSATLQNLIDIYGNVLTMADFGSKGFITFEPESSNAESATFTGITENGNGTYTLTGLKTTLAKSPYTETSGLVRNHAGGTKVVITDTVAYWNSFTNKNNDEVVTGAWTIPNTSDSGSSQSATADDIANAISGASGTATSGVSGTVKVSIDGTPINNPIAVETNDTRVPTQNENNALAGTSGSPSTTNKYATQNDTTNAATITGTTISFTATSTISDSGNGFITAGFQVGQTISVTGSGSNNGTYTITAVAAGAITVAEVSIVNEIAGASVTIDAAINGKLVRMTSSGELPAVDASNLTGITIEQISGGQVDTFTYGEAITAGDAVFVSDGTEVVEITQTTENSNAATYGANWFGQTFTTGNGVTKIRDVSLAMQRSNSPAGNVVVSLYATSAGLPTGAALYTATLTATSVGTSGNLTNSFTLNATVTPNTVYAIVVSVPSGDVTNYIDLDYATSDQYADGTYISSTNSGSTWAADANKDLVFQVEQMFTVGSVYQSDASNGRAVFTGIALENGNSGESKKVQMPTGIITSSGLTAGQYYLSDTPGAISSTPGTIPVIIGQAISSTKLIINKALLSGLSYTVSPSIWVAASSSFMKPWYAPCDGILVNYFTNDTGSGTEATVQRGSQLQMSSVSTLGYMKAGNIVDGNTITTVVKKGYYYRVLYVGTPTGGTSLFYTQN